MEHRRPSRRSRPGWPGRTLVRSDPCSGSLNPIAKQISPAVIRGRYSCLRLSLPKRLNLGATCRWLPTERRRKPAAMSSSFTTNRSSGCARARRTCAESSSVASRETPRLREGQASTPSTRGPNGTRTQPPGEGSVRELRTSAGRASRSGASIMWLSITGDIGPTIVDATHGKGGQAGRPVAPAAKRSRARWLPLSSRLVRRRTFQLPSTRTSCRWCAVARSILKPSRSRTRRE